jgi:hypothetical protein
LASQDHIAYWAKGRHNEQLRMDRCLSAGVLLAFTVIAASSAGRQGRAATPGVTAAQIKAAWADRRQKIKSFEYKCDVVEEERAKVSLDPLREEETDTQIQRKTELSFKLRGSRIALSIHGDWPSFRADSPIRKGCTYLAACDGTMNRDLLTNPERSVPHIGSFKRRGSPQPPLTASSEAMPIWMWYNPQSYLEVTGHDLTGLTVHQIAASTPNGDAIWLTVPKKGNWTADIYAKSEYPYTPLHVVFFREEQEMLRLEMTHSPVAMGSDSLATWKQTQLKLNGSIDYVRTGTNKSYVPNKAFDDAEFVLKFPVGSHLVEFTDDRHERITWIQATETEMKRLDPSEYGRPKLK